MLNPPHTQNNWVCQPNSLSFQPNIFMVIFHHSKHHVFEECFFLKRSPPQKIFDPKRLGMFSVFFHFFPINKVWRHGAKIFHHKKSNFATVSLWESTPVIQCCHETIRSGQSYTRDFWKDTPENRQNKCHGDLRGLFPPNATFCIKDFCWDAESFSFYTFMKLTCTPT